MTRALVASLLALPTAFCQHTEVATPPISMFCNIARPITWVPEDTRITKEQIDAHNRAWKRLCKKK
jgi:hypothetical protein